MSQNNQDKEEILLEPDLTIPPTSILLEQEQYSDFEQENGQPKYLKNIAYGKAQSLADLIDYAPGQVSSKTLVQNSHVGMTLFAMAAGEGISAHKSNGDAFVTALEGNCKITIDGKSQALSQGQCIVMPAGHPHAVHAMENFKMLLVVIFP